MSLIDFFKFSRNKLEDFEVIFSVENNFKIGGLGETEEEVFATMEDLIQNSPQN